MGKRGINFLSPGLIIPLVGIVTSEGLIFHGFTSYALWGHTLTLLACTLAPLRFGEETETFRAFALVPLFRLVNLGMPVFFQLTVFWFPLIYGPLIPGLYLISRDITPISPSVIKHPAQLVALVPFGIILSALLAALEFQILHNEALIPAWTTQNLLMLGIVMIGFVGFVEELLFRGILQPTLEQRYGVWPGLLISSGVFGLMHSGYHLPEEILFAGVIGLLFGIFYDLTDSLAFISIIHGMLNVFLFAVLPMKGTIVPF